MTYAARRNRSRCPTHPGELLREDVIPATGRTKSEIAEITLLQPIGFLSLIWNTILGFSLFSQRPDIWTFVGAAVIFASALYISHREAVRRAQIRSADARPPAAP